jgi:hypothetical protein
LILIELGHQWGLRHESLLVCSINMWGEAKGNISCHDRNPSCHFPRAWRWSAMSTLGCCWNKHREEMIVIDYFLYTDAWLCWTTDLTLPLYCTSSGNNLWSSTHKFSTWLSRISANIAYPFPYKMFHSNPIK